ncbi:hypothetical protein, partial [Cellulomonas septica]
MTELWGPALDAELAFRREQLVVAERVEPLGLDALVARAAGGVGGDEVVEVGAGQRILLER